jgi:CRP-like cAMP-binding protein
VGLLRGLERDEAERFLGKATLIHASAEDHLVRQGELGATLFVLLSGVAEVVIDAAPDRAVALLGPGDTFGEMGFLTPTPRTANVIARTACEIVVLSAEFLHALLARDPAIAAKILLNLSRILARRLSDMNRQLAAQRAAKSPAA